MKLTEEQVAECLDGFVFFDKVYGKWRLDETCLAHWTIDDAIRKTTRRINDLLITNAQEGT